MRALTLMVAGTLGLTYTMTELQTAPTAEMRDSLRPPPPGSPATLHLEPSAHKKRSLFSGIASWYGEVLEGHTTASGEIFHKDELTACHPTLPFGTLVRVINLRNRRSVVVRINDRGKLFPNRVIDLSSAAADRLGMLRAGVARVKLVVVSRPSVNG